MRRYCHGQLPANRCEYDIAVLDYWPRHGVNASSRTVIALAGSVILVALLVVLLSRLDIQDTLLSILQIVEDAGIRGRLLFIAAVSVCVIAMIPSVLLTLGAGALYGVIEGSLIMVFAETIGSTIAFLLARYLLHERVLDMLKHRARLRRAMAIVRTRDWKMVAMLRMIPFFPFKLSNYFLGVTHVAAGPYVLGTLIGLWPMTLFTVYLGSLAANLLSLEAGGFPQSPLQWGLSIAGLVFTGAVVVAVVRRATAIMRENDVLPD